MKTDQNINIIPWNLILKRLKGCTSEDENKRLDAWIEADNQHFRLWIGLQQAWDDIRELNSGFNPDTSYAWQQVVKKTKKQHRKTKPAIPVYWKVTAACLLLLIGIAGGTFIKMSDNQPIAYTQYDTQYGKSFITLPDGTQVWLNARTTLTLSNRFNEHERKVEVNGEALFDVAHNPDCPFLVDMKDMQVKVYGTKFNVQAYDNKAEACVSLLEGSVSLTAAGCPDTYLKPGYTAVYDRVDKKISMNSSDQLIALWAGNELRIEDLPLAEVARLLEGWYHIKIEIDPALKSPQYYTFIVRHESLTELLAVMQKVGKFRYKIDEQKIMIY